jgi:acyl carrier protein
MSWAVNLWCRSTPDRAAVGAHKFVWLRPTDLHSNPRARPFADRNGNNSGTSRHCSSDGLEFEQIAFRDAPVARCLAGELAGETGHRCLARGARSMNGTYDAIADLIVKNCDVERGAITPDSHLFDDLGLDSVDLFDLGFCIEDAFDIEVPIEEWAAGRGEADAASVEDLRMARFCDRIDALREQRKVSEP